MAECDSTTFQFGKSNLHLAPLSVQWPFLLAGMLLASIAACICKNIYIHMCGYSDISRAPRTASCDKLRYRRFPSQHASLPFEHFSALVQALEPRGREKARTLQSLYHNLILCSPFFIFCFPLPHPPSTLYHGLRIQTHHFHG